jgi:hypothetical protein
MAPSAPVATAAPTDDMDTSGTGSPAPEKPLKPKDIKVIPVTAGSGRDDITLDPNFEKEFYVSSYNYKGQTVIVKQVGTGFGKPVRIYINDKRWEFFPGPKTAEKATKLYIDSLMKDAKSDPELARSMTNKVKMDKKQGFSATSQSPQGKPPFKAK